MDFDKFKISNYGYQISIIAESYRIVPLPKNPLRFTYSTLPASLTP
jgi:hypothetical protein